MPNYSETETMDFSLPSIPVKLEEDNSESGTLEILKSVRPAWFTAHTHPTIKSRNFTGGISNKLMGYFLPDRPRDVVIIKTYGPKTEEMIDRAAEIRTMHLLHSLGLGPALYGAFENGIAYEFLPGVILTTDSVRSPHIFPAVAAETARLHSIPLTKNPLLPPGSPPPATSFIWDKLGTFTELGDEALRNNPILRERYGSFGLGPGWGARQVTELEERLEKAKIPLVLCHNDLLLANIIHDPETRSISFIDFEYCGPNYVAFDLANHFNEFAGVEDADFGKCPDAALRSAWIQEYFKGLGPSRPESWTLEKFESWVNLCIPLSHLFWILWTVVQAQNSTIDFDFVHYASLRVAEYEKWMKIIREVV